MWGNTGTLGTLQQISSLVVGEIDFECPTLGENVGTSLLCSTERRLETIDCSLDRWQDGGGEKKVCFKIHCFLSIKQTIRQKFVRICRHKQL